MWITGTFPPLNKRCCLQSIFVFSVLFWGTAVCRAQYSESNNDPFLKLNSAFRSAYAGARAELLRGAGPVVMSRGDYLVLYYRGRRYEGEKTDPSYHQLKTVAHVPLAIYVMLAGHADAPLSDKKRDELREFRDLIPPVRVALGSSGLTPCQQDGQRRQLDRCQSFLEQVLDQGRIGHGDLIRFCTRCTADFMQNTLEAARSRLQAYHRQMAKWKKMIAPKDWAQLQVVVVGAQMPRRGNLAVQYFARLLGEAGECKRIIYAEALFDEEKALNLLGTHRLDASAAEAFFGDPLRLHRDLLADATPAVLDTLDWSELRALDAAKGSRSRRSIQNRDRIYSGNSAGGGSVFGK
jgi:hypothetical protein